MFNLEYDYLGNITAPSWNVNRGSFSIGNVKQYRVAYDAASRITASTYWTMNTSWAWTNGNQYTENGLQYDLNGNIKALQRQGLISGTTFGNMDNLTYTYDSNNPDRLTRVQDSYSATKGFIQGSTAATTYTYDNAGNLTSDLHKNLTINYNFLNLPAVITKASQNISFAYTTSGVKLTKYVGGVVSRQYVGGLEYDNTTLAAIYTPEGRVIPNGASWHYEYSIKDHLGNVRVNFRANTSTTSYTFLDEHHYYPFGLEQEGSTFGGGDKYRYNGKEINEDLGLNWNDYGARWYDPALGRWNSVDILSEIQVDQSVYQYSYNNPVTLNDPSGMCPTCNSGETESADGLTNSQWIEANRGLDGGQWNRMRDYRVRNNSYTIRHFTISSANLVDNSLANATEIIGAVSIPYRYYHDQPVDYNSILDYISNGASVASAYPSIKGAWWYNTYKGDVRWTAKNGNYYQLSKIKNNGGYTRSAATAAKSSLRLRQLGNGLTRLGIAASVASIGYNLYNKSDNTSLWVNSVIGIGTGVASLVGAPVIVTGAVLVGTVWGIGQLVAGEKINGWIDKNYGYR